MFVAIAYQPNPEVFRAWLALDEGGYINTNCDSTETNVAGVFACGDAQDSVYRQAITAAGTVCRGTIDVERWLQSQEQVAAKSPLNRKR